MKCMRSENQNNQSLTIKKIGLKFFTVITGSQLTVFIIL